MDKNTCEEKDVYTEFVDSECKRSPLVLSPSARDCF